MKKIIVCLCGIGFAAVCLAVDIPSVVVETVQFRQRYPWNGLVDIDAKITCSDVNTNLAVYVAAWDNVKDRALTVKTIWIEGDETKDPDLTVRSGMTRIVWDARADNPGEISSDVSVFVQAYVKDMRYLVIDLSGGPNAKSYPYYYRAAPPKGGWTVADKTTNIVMRLILPGMFMMGSPEDELGHDCALGSGIDRLGVSCETLHKVALSRQYYIGVFEITIKQWELVSGTTPSFRNPSAGSEYLYRCPVENVSYDMIRGSSNGRAWPSHNVVDADSFVGCIRRKAKLLVDLPTEAQWEYACRAGTTTSLNCGKNLTYLEACENIAMVGRYGYNHKDGKGGWHDYEVMVGQYLPNAWGLYDMHGNVAEWCLDWWQKDIGQRGVVDPKGPSSGSYRVIRGGSYASEQQKGSAAACRSAYRNYYYYNTNSSIFYDTRPNSSMTCNDVGLRIVVLPSDE